MSKNVHTLNTSIPLWPGIVSTVSRQSSFAVSMVSLPLISWVIHHISLAATRWPISKGGRLARNKLHARRGGSFWTGVY